MPDTTATDALQDLIKLIVDAFNDTENAMGQGKTGLSFMAYGSLLKDVLKLAGEVGQLPAEVSALAPADIAALIQTASEGLEIQNSKAKDLVGLVVGLIGNLLNVTLGQVEAISGALHDLKAS